MKRVLPILLCLLALAVPRLYGQDRTVTFSHQPAEGGSVEASYFISWEEPPVTIGSGDKVNNNEYVTFKAIPNEGYEVDKWEFNGTPDASAAGKSECSKTIDADMTVVVYFKKTAAQSATHTVTVSAEPASEKNYVAIKDYDTFDPIASGSAVEDGKAINVYAYFDKNKYKFDYWEVNGVRSEEFTSDKIRNYVVTKDVTFKAYYKELAMLPVTFSVNGPGTIEVKNSSGKILTSGDKVLEGAYVRFVATPGENAELRDWTINGATDKAGKTKFSYKMDPTKPNTFVANFVSTATTQEYVVTFVADPIDGGTVTAENTATYATVKSGASVAENSYLKFKAEPKEGYEFDNWTVNGLPADGSFTDPMELSREITGETSVVAHFKSVAPAEEYTVTFAAEPEGQGTLTATHYDRENDEEVPFESGEKFSGESIFITFTAKPGADYKVEKWLVNDEAIAMPSNPNEYIHELKADVDVKVVFTAKPNEVTLQYSVPTGEGGQIAVAVTPKGGGDAVSVESGKKVARGSSVTFTATPSEGYEVEKWLVNGSEDRKAGQNTTLTMTLEEDTDVQLYFKKEAAKYVVNFTADPVKGGTITASGYVNGQLKTITTGESLPEGSYIDFEATANEGYEFEKFTVNGADGTPDFANPNKLSQEITAETNIVAHFKSVASKITITYTAGEHGKFTEVKVQKDGEKDVIINSGDEVDRGAYIVFNVEPDKGYIVDKWTVNGEEVHSREVNSYDSSFEETSEVKVTFRKPKLTIAPAEGGKVVALVGDKEVSNDADVALGANVSIEATPDAGYELTALTANDKDILAAKSFAMKGDTKVVATFTKKAQPTTYKVTLKDNEHGKITIKEKVDLNAVPEGTKLTVEAKGANDQCELTKLTANGEDILKDMTFTVTKDTEVVAVFVDHTGVDAVATVTLTVYPNPARETASVTGLAPEADVALYTLDGQLVTRLVADRAGRLQIDLTALSDGTYLVVTEGAAQRLVVKH